MLRTLAIGAVATMLIGFAAQPASAGCWSYRDSEKQLASRINSTRGRHGRAKLRLDPQLSKVSRTHSAEMAGRRTLYHTPTSVLGSRVTRWVSLGENVARTRTVRSAMRLMMRSTYHRSNILGAGWVHFGVGTVRKGGRIWSTVTFESLVDPGTTLAMC